MQVEESYVFGMAPFTRVGMVLLFIPSSVSKLVSPYCRSSHIPRCIATLTTL